MNETRQFSDHSLCKNENNEVSGDEDWSESSYDSSCNSDSDSSIPDWDSSVDEKTGQVLYIECHPFVTQTIRDDKKDKEKIFSRNQSRRSTRGKFLQLLRRKEVKRYSKRNIKILDSESHNTNKVKFQDFQEGEEREVTLKVLNEHVLRGNNLVETLLGINVSTLSDGMRLMVAGFLHDSYAKYERNIKIGDWLKSVNGLEVNLQNINTVLQQLSGKNEVLIKLQRVAGVEVTKDPPINILNNQSAFVRQLTSFTTEEDENLQELCKLPFGFAYIATDKLDEMGTEYQDIIYCYPRPVQKNTLCNSKGIFLTLSHLLQDITKSATKLTSLFFDKILCHITYAQFEKNLFLLMLPEMCAKPEELEAIAAEISRMLIFTYDTLENCFKNEEIQHVDHIFSMFFKRMINGGQWTGELKLQDGISGIPISDYMFEDTLPAVCTLNLPNEAVIQIEDALTELEACDYREWNEEPLDCQRIFTVLGSAWYHSGYLLASHLTYEDLVDIHFFCKYQGILHLSKTEPVKTLILWRECFPTSCRALTVPIYKLPEARRYLLIVGSGKDLLVVIMEAGGSTEFPEVNAAPDPFYVEEAQATLAHLQDLGLPELADRFIEMNPGPQVTIPVASSNKKKLDVLNFSMSAKQAQFRLSTAQKCLFAAKKIFIQKVTDLSNCSRTYINMVFPLFLDFTYYFRDSATKKPEVTSILKRRSNDQSQTIYTSTYSLSEDTYDVHSEDSGSQGCGSELSDDPVAGRNGDKKNKYDSASDESGNEGNCVSFYIFC
ncbi:hypothetical protein WA026_003744 [Henosepilachna vigintioctopunctata]|uniref:Protein inturned n=1 Tax=Henosepilachna vigintioctopunctata TaxID=420089 RepID=A0AAW1U5J2_9CUCU